MGTVRDGNCPVGIVRWELSGMGTVRDGNCPVGIVRDGNCPGWELSGYHYECIGHFQKRVGNRLRKLRKEKKLGGAKRLTNKKIDILQKYFGIALRNNIGDLEKMTNAITASVYHVS